VSAGLRKAALVACAVLSTLAAGEALARLSGGLPRPHPLGWEGRLDVVPAPEGAPRILALGDSYTFGTGVDASQVWPRALASAAGAAVTVYSAPGYGTAQEALALERLFDAARPDLILLQVCFNDVIDGSRELESASFYNRQPLLKPYLEEGRVVLRSPLPAWRRPLAARSALALRAERALQNARVLLRHHGIGPASVEDAIRTQGDSHPGYRRALEAVDAALARMQDRAGRVPIVAVPVDDEQPYMEGFAALARRRGIPLRAEVPGLLRASGMRLPNDPHLSEEGHRVLGQHLARALSGLIHRH
jgi:lysophospholipase L1-like esterase